MLLNFANTAQWSGRQRAAATGDSDIVPVFQKGRTVRSSPIRTFERRPTRSTSKKRTSGTFKYGSALMESYKIFACLGAQLVKYM